MKNNFFKRLYLILAIFSIGFVCLKAPIPPLSKFLVDNGLLTLTEAEKSLFEALKLDEFQFNVFGGLFDGVKNNFMVTEEGLTQADINAYLAETDAEKSLGSWAIARKIESAFKTRSSFNQAFCFNELRRRLSSHTFDGLFELNRLNLDIGRNLLTGYKIDYSDFVSQSEIDQSKTHYSLIRSLYQKFVNAKIAKKLLSLPDEKLMALFNFEQGEQSHPEAKTFSILGGNEQIFLKRKSASWTLKAEKLIEIIDADPKLQSVNPAEFREFLFSALENEMNAWIKGKLVSPPASGFSSSGFRATTQGHVIDLWAAVHKEKYQGRVRTIAAISTLLGIIGFGSSFLFKKFEGNKTKTKRSRRRNLLINGLKFGGLATALMAGGFLCLYEYKNRDLLKLWSGLKQGVPFSRLWHYVFYV